MKCEKFQVDLMKVVRLMLPADLKNTVLKKTCYSRDFEKKLQIFLYTLKYVQ